MTFRDLPIPSRDKNGVLHGLDTYWTDIGDTENGSWSQLLKVLRIALPANAQRILDNRRIVTWATWATLWPDIGYSGESGDYKATGQLSWSAGRGAAVICTCLLYTSPSPRDS